VSERVAFQLVVLPAILRQDHRSLALDDPREEP
jgi:hypothetical protein